MTEYALLDDRGEIINVVTTSHDLATVEATMRRVLTEDVVIRPLDQVSDAVKQRYRYWDERP